MDDVAQSGESILITKRGKVVAKLGPPNDTRPQALGCLKHTLEIIAEDFTLITANARSKSLAKRFEVVRFGHRSAIPRNCLRQLGQRNRERRTSQCVGQTVTAICMGRSHENVVGALRATDQSRPMR